MTVVDLHDLRDEHVFDPTPSREELYRFHVPFDELTGHKTCEGPLFRAIRNGEQVALAGETGSGKSSVIGHVLGPLVEGVAPLPIPVDIDRPEVAGNPVEFAANLVRTVARYVEHAMPREAERARELADHASPMAGGERRRRRFGGAIGWLKAKVELAAELEELTAQHPRPAQEILDQARAILDLIKSYDLQPVLEFDDTDKWFGEGIPEAEELLNGFFDRIVRLIAEDLAVTAVIPVHTRYFEHPAWNRAAGLIESTIKVPRVPTADALGRLLTHRTYGQQVLTREALEALFDHYNAVKTSNLRQRVLLVVHSALSIACDEDVERIGLRHIELAIAEFGEPGGWWRGIGWGRNRR